MANIANILNDADRILQLLSSAAMKERVKLWGVDDEFEKLKDSIARVLDAEPLQPPGEDERVRRCLGMLENAVNDTDDFLEDFLELASRRGRRYQNIVATKVCSFFSVTSSNPIVFRLKICSALKKVTKALAEAYSSMCQLAIEFGSHKKTPVQVGETAELESQPFVYEKDVLGEIMKLVLEATKSSEKNLRVVPIVGIEGIGKTTLAQLVYDDPVIAAKFDLRMWVCVSDLIYERLIVRKLIESATDEMVDGFDFLLNDELQKQLRETLNRKRFFLVLDDVHDEIQADWESLRNLLMGGAKGSTLLVTTRSEKVAEVMSSDAQSYHLGPLSNTDSCLLPKRAAFGANGQEQEVQSLKKMGRQTAEKCKAVRLLIRNVVSSLSLKSSADDRQRFVHEGVLRETKRSSGLMFVANYDNQKTKVVTAMSREQSHSFEAVPKEEVFGRLAVKEEIIAQLLKHKSGGKIVLKSIYGIQGVGKTTFAQLIFNDCRVQNHFDLRIWVTVADVFDLESIVRKITASLKTRELGNLPFDELTQLIRHGILGMRFLIILDDIRDGNDLISKQSSKLISYLRNCANGSRLIVTTRSEVVAAMTASRFPDVHKLNTLDEDSCWSVFLKVAFESGQEPTNSKIKEIGKKIVANCGGIPLAIRTIGGMMHSKKTETEWQSFYEEELPKIFNGENMLKLSYNHLPSHLKPCFAYCGIFPKDYEIDVQTLINLWMSLGFVDCENMGCCCFLDLLRRSLLKETMRDEWGRITRCKMQNFMCTDLARSVASNAYATLGMKGGINGTNARHVSFDFHLDSSWHIRLLAQSKRIRSLMLHGQSHWEVEGRSSESVCAEVAKFKYLRMLDLHNSGIRVVADSICHLKHLRYLDLSQNVNIKALPNSIGRLWNLQTLKLNRCSNLQKFPRAVTKLVNLRNLENESCCGLTHMPQGLGQLTNLRTLSEFVLSNGTGSVTNNRGKLNELEKLNELRGKLKIKNLRCLGSEGTTRAKLKEKEHLVSLVLVWDTDAAVKESDYEKLLNDLQPHPNLRELSLSAYGGVWFSSWLQQHENLVKLSLSRCTKCKCLLPLHHLPRLEVLLVDDLPELEYVSEDNPRAFFQSLRELQLTNLPKLAGWWKLDAAGVDEMAEFPRLSTLIIEDCPSLISLPLFPYLDRQLLLKNTRWEPLRQSMTAQPTPTATDVAPSVPLSKLKTLSIINMPTEGLEVWKSLSSLRSVTFDCVQDIYTFLNGLNKVTKLQELHIWRCESLRGIPNVIGNIKSLRILSLKLCPNLTIPRDKINLITSLQKVEIEDCPQLSHIQCMLEDPLYGRS